MPLTSRYWCSRPAKARFWAPLPDRFADPPGHPLFAMPSKLEFTRELRLASRALRSFAKGWNLLAQRLAWPYLELLMRLWLAKLFFSFGVQELMHWTLVMRMAGEENPFPWLTPTMSASLSTGANLIGAVLLALGLMTRYASLPLLILAAITQFRFEPFDTQLFWVALFGWFVIHGAGPISLDNLLRRGLSDSAIPLIPRAIRFSQWLRAFGTRWYLSGLHLGWARRWSSPLRRARRYGVRTARGGYRSMSPCECPRWRPL